MSDLVECLRKYVADRDHPAVTSPVLILLTEAAARIEALEAALREIAHGEDFKHETIGIALKHARSTAQAALVPEPEK